MGDAGIRPIWRSHARTPNPTPRRTRPRYVRAIPANSIAATGRGGDDAQAHGYLVHRGEELGGAHYAAKEEAVLGEPQLPGAELFVQLGGTGMVSGGVRLPNKIPTGARRLLTSLVPLSRIFNLLLTCIRATPRSRAPPMDFVVMRIRPHRSKNAEATCWSARAARNASVAPRLVSFRTTHDRGLPQIVGHTDAVEACFFGGPDDLRQPPGELLGFSVPV